MSTTLSHFANVKNLQITPTGGTAVSIGSTDNVRIEKRIARVEGQDNNVIGGPVSTHVIGRGYTFSFNTRDISALSTLNTTTGAFSLSFVWVAAETQAGTPMANQTITLAGCVLDDNAISPETKSSGSYTVRGHTIGIAADADQFSMAAAS